MLMDTAHTSDIVFAVLTVVGRFTMALGSVCCLDGAFTRTRRQLSVQDRCQRL